MTLGSYPGISLTSARGLHKEAALLVKQGIDPRHHKAAVKAEVMAVLTMQQLHERWISHLIRSDELKPATIQEHSDRWSRYIQKQVGNIRLDHITRAHLASALDKMREHSREQTRKAMSTLNGMLDYALARGMVQENPMRLLRPKDFAASTPEGRSRWLTLAELKMLWHAIESKGETGRGVAATSVLSSPMIGVIKTVILTGVRREEAVGMRWDELDLDAGLWVLPSSRTKNSAGHTVFLPKLLIALLKDRRSQDSDSSFVFTSPRRDKSSSLPSRMEDKPITPHSVSRAIKRLQEPEHGTQPQGLLYQKMAEFTLHDLRRTCATHWEDTLKVDSRVVELMLNHLPADKLVRTYQRGKHIDRQREAWLKWGELIEKEIVC